MLSTNKQTDKHNTTKNITSFAKKVIKHFANIKKYENTHTLDIYCMRLDCVHFDTVEPRYNSDYGTDMILLCIQVFGVMMRLR